MSKFRRLSLFLLVLLTTTIWLAVIFYPNNKLRVIACDVGQGDAILASYANVQILVDGGPNSKVFGCLSKYMPFWDRKVELIVNTHPQKDHFMGLIAVLKRYEVQTFMATALDSSTQDWKALKSEVGSRGVRVFNSVSGQKLRIGLIHLDILWPSGEFLSENLTPNSNLTAGESANGSNAVLGAFTSKRDPNDFSIVAILSYKDFDALLTGDVSPLQERKIVGSGMVRSVEYIKVPHHGSKNGLTKDFLDAASPDVAVISVGKNNSYGHPHEEILKMLNDKKIKILRTDEMGDVVVETDGKEVWID